MAVRQGRELVDEVARALRRLGCDGARLLVAVSGGVDSLALLSALHELAERHRLKLSIGHVNHGLRGAESEADGAAVRAAGEALALPVHCQRVAPRELRAGGPSRDRPTLQEAARTLRYAALRRLAAAAGAERVATAHTADDQAETVLMRLLRGSGPDGLAGIPERSPDGRLLRPLLRVSRAQVLDYARARALHWREDASNRDPRYARNRLRERWLPGLAREFNPRLLMAIANLAEAQRRDSEWIAREVEREAARRLWSEGGWLRIDGKDWQALPAALARRLAAEALRRCGTGRLVARVQLERMLGFLNQGRVGTYIELPGGLRLQRDRRGYRLGPRPAGERGVNGETAC